MKKKYTKQQKELIEKQFKKINNAITKLLIIRSGGAENYEQYKDYITPLKEFQILYKKENEDEEAK